MPTHDVFKNYIKQVCSQIRIKQVHLDIEQELTCHMNEQKQSFIDEGLEETIAAQKTIQEMGDPILVGGQLDQTHRPRPDKKLVLFASGMILFAAILQLLFFQAPNYWLSLFLGVALCFAFYYIDYTIFARFCWLFFAIFTAGSIALILFRSALFVWLFIPIYCGILYKMKGKRYFGLAVSCVVILVPFLLATLVPNLFTAFSIGLTCVVLLLLCIVKEWFAIKRSLGIILIAAPIALLTILILYRHADRFAGLFSADSYLAHVTQVIINGVQAIGESTTLSTPYPPDALFSPDTILVYILVRFGILPTIAICMGIVCFIALMLYTAHKQKNAFASLVSYGCAIAYATQCSLFLVATLLSPLGFFGESPFLFSHNTLVISNMILLGVFLCASKWNGVVSEQALFQWKKSAQPSK